MKTKWNLRTTVCLVLAILYVLGLVFLLTGRPGGGLALLGISTVAGMGVLYLVRKNDKEKTDSENDKEEN